MSYSAIADAARNTQLRLRIAACVAKEGHAGLTLETGALMKADSIQWQCCAQPGWGEAWAYAQANGSLDPGADGSVIPDSWILSAVQALMG